MARTLKLQSRRLSRGQSGRLVTITPRRAGWRYIEFAARQLARGATWRVDTGRDELCVVLLEGDVEVSWGTERHRLGPRADVFSAYPHAVYLPPRTRATLSATMTTQVAECRAPAAGTLPARIIRPDDCGFEIRGGGNATRQIVDIVPPGFPAERLMICEVFTPGGNWSSYPPHKHDTDAPPVEVDLDETYYYRFRERDAFGVQRLYGPHDRGDVALTVRDGELVLVRGGYHPFVSAHGYDAYYLNVLAGRRRSMAASDDPRYAPFRKTWPSPDPRVPLVAPPYDPSAPPRPSWAAPR